MRILYFDGLYLRYLICPQCQYNHRNLRSRPRYSGYASLFLSPLFERRSWYSIGLINSFGVRLLKSLNTIAIWWNALGTIAVIIAVLAAAPSHQSGDFVFRTFIDGTGVDGVGWSERASLAYVVVIGVLFTQYSLTGTSIIFMKITRCCEGC